MNKKQRTAFYGITSLVFIIGLGFLVNQAPSRPISSLLTAAIGSIPTADNPYINLKKGFGYNTEGFVRTFEQFLRSSTARSSGFSLARQSDSTILRFPGGNVANFYHSNAPGYGYKKNEIPNNSFYNAAYNWSQTQTENLIYPFMRYAESVGAKRILFVANLYTGTVEEAEFVIDTFQKNGFEVVGIELGNEFYYAPFNTKITSAQVYANIAKPFIERFNQKYPNIPLGVISWEHTGPISEKMGFPKVDEWNRTVANIPGVDALIIHKYANIRSCESQTTIVNAFNCMKNLTNYDFFNWGDRLVDYKRGFTPDKRLWFTEFNVEDSAKRVGNTFLHAANIYEILMQSFNEKFARNFDFLIHHNFIATGRGMAAFYREGNNGQVLLESAQARAIGMYREIFEKSIRPSKALLFTSSINLADNNSKKDFVYRLVETRNGHALVFINKSDKDIQLEIKDGRKNLVNIIEQNVLGGPDIWSAIDARPAYRDDSNIFAPWKKWVVSTLENKTLSMTGNNLVIPKYHLGWIEFSR